PVLQDSRPIQTEVKDNSVLHESDNLEDDLLKQNQEAPLKENPSSDKFEAKDASPQVTILQDPNYIEFEIKDKVPLNASQESNNLEIDLQKQNVEDSPQTFQQIYDQLAIKGVFSNDSQNMPADNSRLDETSSETQQPVYDDAMTFQKIQEELIKRGDIDNNSQSIPSSIGPENNNTQQFTNYNNPVIMSTVSISQINIETQFTNYENSSPQFSIGTYSNTPPITTSAGTGTPISEADYNTPLSTNNEIYNPATILGTSTSQFSYETNKNFSSSVTIDTPQFDNTLPSVTIDTSQFNNISPSATIDTPQFDNTLPSVTKDTFQFNNTSPSATLDTSQFDNTLPSITTDTSQFNNTSPSATLDTSQFNNTLPPATMDKSQFNNTSPSATLDTSQFNNTSPSVTMDTSQSQFINTSLIEIEQGTQTAQTEHVSTSTIPIVYNTIPTEHATSTIPITSTKPGSTTSEIVTLLSSVSSPKIEPIVDSTVNIPVVDSDTDYIGYIPNNEPTSGYIDLRNKSNNNANEDSDSTHDNSQSIAHPLDDSSNKPASYPESNFENNNTEKVSTGINSSDSSEYVVDAKDYQLDPHFRSQPTGILSKVKNMWPFTSGKDEDKYGEYVKVTFHVHLPQYIERYGEPVILGNCKELGGWTNITIQLTQPHKREFPTYWRSHPVEIQIGGNEIKYKYGIFSNQNVDFEGEGEMQNRTLDTRTNDQYDIWRNNRSHNIFDLREFAFIRCIYDAVNIENLKDKVMQFQILLENYRDFALKFLTIDFIAQHCHDKKFEKRLFLCVLLGYYIKHRKDPRSFIFQLPTNFRSNLLLEALEYVQHDTFTSDIQPIMVPVVSALVRHNAIVIISFEWLRIFRVAQVLDPRYTFVDGFIGANYNKDRISRLLKEWPKLVVPYLDKVDEHIYIKIAKWLMSFCLDMETLNIIWRDNIYHTRSIDNEILIDFSGSVHKIIAHDDASALYVNYTKVVPEYRAIISGLFRERIVNLLKTQQGGWDQNNLQALGRLLKDKQLYSERDHFLNAMDYVSLSAVFNLLNLFPDLLEYWINSKFSNSRSPDVLRICQQWFTRIISNLNYNHSMSLNEGGRFIYTVYEHLTRLKSLLNDKSKIYQELLYIASERIKKCSHNHILFATVQVGVLNKSITEHFRDLVTENILVARNIRNPDKNLMDMICWICGQENLDKLDVPNSLSENLLCYIMNCLESQVSHIPDQQLDLIKHTDFWRIIFNARGNVTNLHRHSHVTRMRSTNSNLAGSIVDRTIDIKTLQIILSKYNYQLYKLANSKTFINIYETQLNRINEEIDVDYVINTLIPAVHEEHTTTFKKYKDKKWEQIKYSDAFPLWKGVTDIRTELELISEVVYLSKSNHALEDSLKHLNNIPKWEERLQKLSTIVEIFKVPLKTEDWLGRSLKWLREDILSLGKLSEFVNYIKEHNPLDNENYWALIKELSFASEILEFLQTIAEHDIKNLINGVDDYSDERLIQEDTVSSLIQVKQLVVQLMRRKYNNIGEFLKVLGKISHENPSLPSKITICAGFNMTLQNMLRNIENRGEVTEEKIQNAVLRGIYTFEKDDKSDKFNVTLVYQTDKTDKMTYNMSDLQDLCGRALLIVKHANIGSSTNTDLTDKEISRKIMNEFVLQVDTAQEILNVGSKLIQMGHFYYRQFKKKIIGTEKRFGTTDIKDLLAKFKADLYNWKKAVDEAQEQYYYLTFFPARHILACFDYFTSDVQNNENTETCKTLIKFVNSKAELPPRKYHSGISHNINDYSRTLNEIGKKLQSIFGKLPKTTRELRVGGERIIADVVDSGKLCVASCSDKLRVPNIIMSLYANHRGKLFCIANLELLEFEMQYGLVESIRSMREKQNDYFLALVCCREGSFHHHILDQFSEDAYPTNGLNAETMETIYRDLCSNVICISSDLSGQGKTEWIKQASFEKKKIPRSFLISDGADFESLVRQLKDCKLQQFESLHINIVSADNSNEINMFLFELLTLGFVSSNVDIASFPQIPVFIEVASTVQQKLLNSLPITGYLVKEHLSWNIRNLKISFELCSPIQIVCNYLDARDRDEIDARDIVFHGQNCIKKPLSDKRCQDLITKYFFEGNADGVSSFRFVEIFVNVLADQLARLSSSAYFKVENLILLIKKETLLRTTLVDTLINVSKEFATRSVKTKMAQLESIFDDYDVKFEIIQWDKSIHLLVLFMSQNPDSICALYRERNQVPENVKNFLKSQVMTNPDRWELEDYNRMPPSLLLKRLEGIARRTMYDIRLPLYALSADNIIKMALILLRARANVPVVVMGEAGCGKSSLIGFLAKVVEVNYEAFNLHAGIKEQDILYFMGKAHKRANNGEIWLFFDEINTCNHIGLLANLIVHRTLQGKLVHPNIRLFAACNPYRKRTRAQSQTGLKNKVKRYEESNLVYQVKPLPDQILDYVWDYGVLLPSDEKKYIQIMVESQLGERHELFTELLFASQQFIRSIEEDYSVSLRDIKRAIKLVLFFNKSLQDRPRSAKDANRYPNPNSRIGLLIRCYILALGLCYQCRIYDQESRREYRQEMIKVFQKFNETKSIKEDGFIKVIRDEQEDWIKRMQLPPNTAMNEALLENVLVMIVCILTKIPVFIIGQNLCGSDSNDRYFRKLPQGSSSSTSDGIIKVFQKAVNYQETSSKEFPVMSVVVLDNVGLAENSPHNPLKVLHALLEPNYPSDGPAVSVVGISNWRLDNSKSSRALLVQSIEDFVDTAVRLLDTKLHNSITRASLQPLAKAYLEYEGIGQSHSNFHGLRDYYGLVKSLSKLDLSPENVQMALERNFGGTDRNENLCEEYFETVLRTFNDYQNWTYNPTSILTLIKANLDDENARHLMVIGKSDSMVTILTYQLIEKKLDPVVILGSQFQDDQQDYSYSVLSRIMNYILFGSKHDPKYYTRVALGAYSNPMLHVHKNFRCILVLDEKKLATADPPLLNRFEKQRMTIYDTFTDNHRRLDKILSTWAQQMAFMVETNMSQTSFTLNDLFIGFDENETLQSLVIDIMTKFPEDEEKVILKRCKAALIDIASSDGIIRASKSNVDPREIDLWKNVYFRNFTDEHIPAQCHDSLSAFLACLLYTSNAVMSRIIINTFSNINTDVAGCLKDLITCQVDKLSTFKTEAQLQNRIKRFWEESNEQMLILQCDVTTVNAGCIKLAKFIIEQFQNEFMRKNPKNPKYVCIILHIQRDQKYMSSFNFMCGWKQVTIETLTQQERNLSTILNGSLTDIISNEYKFEEILEHELLWCLLCIKYPSTSKSVDHIKTLKADLMKCSFLIECLKERALNWIEENSTDGWQYQVASDKRLLYPYPSFSAALLAYLRSLVRHPIAKLLFALEKLSLTKTFISINHQKKYQTLISFLQKMFFDPNVLSIKDLPEPKPDRYVMSEHFYDLKFPFSYYFMKKINEFRVTWEDELARLCEDPANCDDNQELSHDAFENAVKGFSANVMTSLPAINEQIFRDFSDLYFKDFVTVIVANDADMKDPNLLEKLLQQLIGRTNVLDPVLLHIYWWKHSNVVSANLQLAQMCPLAITEFVRERSDITFEEFLIDKVIKTKLDQIVRKDSAPQLDQWQHEVVKILSLSAKVLKTNKLRSYQLLRICNDIVSSKLIELPNIKDIIKLGLASDEQNVLSKKFIDHVLGILSKLEKTEQNLILQRSFIMSCLNTIPLESNVRQSLYNNIFSQDPFPLMGSIITKIFWNEEEDAFLRILRDTREIFQASPRLKVINSALKSKSLDSSMATLCCDIIQKEFFLYMDIPEMAQYFGHAVQALLEKTVEPLKRISAIAFLKEFVSCMWNQTLQDDYTLPISFIGIMEVGEFDGDVLIEEINIYMTIDDPLIHSFKVYFLRELRHKGLSIDDLKRFCATHTPKFPWLSTFKWNDNKDTRLPFNPYWQLPEYRQAENAFKELYSINNKALFQTFIQQLQNANAFRARIALIGLIMSRLHVVRASREWGAPEIQAADFLKVVNTMNNLSTGYRQIIGRILSNNQTFLRLDNSIDNSNLLLKSVIAHIIALHASIPPDSTPFAAYFHKIETCQNTFILATVSDIESLILSAVVNGGGGPITRGHAVVARRCPECKNNTIGGQNYRLAAGNRKLDNVPITGPIKSKDQPGYIGEPVNNEINHSVRSMTPCSYRILHLIVHALIGSSAHIPATLNFLRKHNQTATNTEQYCLGHIITDWKVLRQILNCSDENLALLFHSLITTITHTPPPASMLRTQAEREDWETHFTRNYVSPLIRSVTETVTNFRTALDAAAAGQGNIIESEIDQTRAIDDEYRLSNLPRLWRKIDSINFNSFRAYYNGDLVQYQAKYPFLAVFFKYIEQLEIIQKLWPIVQFVQILSSRLSYRISRKDAENMTFAEFIDKEADRADLIYMFKKFEESWNEIIDKVDRYQCYELPQKPMMNRNMCVIMGLVEAKDNSIYLCAILEYLITLQNNFLQDVMTIPPGSCRALKYLEQTSFNADEGTSTATTSQYSIRTLTLNKARSDNIIVYNQEEFRGIHMFSQRNLGVGRGLDVIYDLQKIEVELARQLVFEKVYIDTVGENSLYMEPFTYHMELFQRSARILGDIQDLIPQEPIPPEQVELLIGSSTNSPYAFQLNNIDTSFDNPSEILSSLEILLCFIKRTPGCNCEILIKEYVNQWTALSGLNNNHEFRTLLNKPFKLKHIISLYELIEGQVANLTIDYIHDKYAEELTPEQREEIKKIIDFEAKQPATMINGKVMKISAETVATALKRFIYRFLQGENQKETDPLYLYVCDSSLHFWPPIISESDLDELFPQSLLVSQALVAYKYVIDQIDVHIQIASQREQQIQLQLTNPEANRRVPPTPVPQPSARRKQKRFNDYLNWIECVLIEKSQSSPNVAEKPSLAEAITKLLAPHGQYNTKKLISPVHEYYADFRGTMSKFKFTSVKGCLDFTKEFNSWNIDPLKLFTAQTIKQETSKSGKSLYVKLDVDYVILWLDCDREGENICFEVIKNVRRSMKQPPNGQSKDSRILRAKFSAITATDIRKAMDNLIFPNKNESLAVDARQELDLKIGCAFTRFQTRFFNGKYGDLDANVISYGPCQTPTLSFCVSQHDKIKSFSPETFWTLSVSASKQDVKGEQYGSEISLNWDRVKLFDKHVELLKFGSSYLGIGPHETMLVAERLYTQGYISYPRTETTSYPKNFDIKSVLKNQSKHPLWGLHATELLEKGFDWPTGGTDAGDHPPITPMRVAQESELSGDLWKIYNYVTRHFLGSISSNLKYQKTNVIIKIGHETFECSEFQKDEVLKIINVKLVEGQTSPPDYLTESEVISLMEKNGIGTDASIPVHINNICQRNYVTVQGSARRLVPTNLEKIDPDLSLPTMRSDVEKQLNYIALGKAEYTEIGQMDELFEATFSSLASTGKILSKCGKCKRPVRLHCSTCDETYSLPANGHIKDYKGLQCPFDDFGLVSFSTGSKDIGYPLCPYCYNHPPFENIRKGMGCNRCPHPTCEHSLVNNGICSCQANLCKGQMVLDATSAPRWKLSCNECNFVSAFLDMVKGVSISKDDYCENEECNSCILKIEFRENQNKKSLKGCVLCDDEIAELLENK
ncbi:11795_t:CDS:10, partial [Scutellospora calospora]